MEAADVKKLWEKYNNGTCSLEEKAMMDSWFINLAKSNEGHPTKEEFLNAERVIARGLPLAQSPGKKIKLPSWLIPAALVLLISGLLIYLYSPLYKPVNTPVVVLKDVAPGGNKAILKLANGTVVKLDDQKAGTIINQGNVSITKSAEGQLVYNGKPDEVTTDQVNVIEIPKGGQYQLMLSDGTKIWLNADSKLAYPMSFKKGKERIVKLSGEAYFEVAKDKTSPFKVQTENQLVEVLGTHFNINSYSDELVTRTTLLEGAVLVQAGEKENKKSIRLKPGEESVLTETTFSKLQADVETAVAWKDGRMKFLDASIPTIMRQVARWYNLKIEYQGEIPPDTFTGAIKRQSNLSTVLKMFKDTEIHFEITQNQDERKLTIKP